MRTRGRGGFTLVELLVVISIIAMLASLLMPAVNRAREAARRTQCMNNMRNVALAMMQYDTAKQKLPGWANNLCPNLQYGARINNTPPESYASSWVFELLPYIEKGDLYYLYGANNTDPSSTSLRCYGTGGTLPQEQIKLLVCPNDSGAVGTTNSLSYVVNCGVRDRANVWRTTSVGVSGDHGAAQGDSYREPPANGVFHNNFYTGTTTAINPRTSNSLAYISAGDGTASTLMVSENVDATFWNGSNTQISFNVYEGAVCFCWTAADPTTAATDVNNGMKINAKIGLSALYSPRPSGNHDSGVNVIFCDAHSAFISENIDWLTWCLLHTPNGRQVMQPASNKFVDNQALTPFRYTPLNEKY